MSHTPHEIGAEFPDDLETIHELKLTSPHFLALAETYHDVNRRIHRVEAQIEPASDDMLHDLKRQRLALKDEIAVMIAATKRAVA